MSTIGPKSLFGSSSEGARWNWAEIIFDSRKGLA
jgi:hypothetical protein